MKVGQLLSMDAGDLLPPELRDILARLRADARAIPMSQLVAVLSEHWGEGWERHFKQFTFTTMAAASIGQVHAAHDLNGRHLRFHLPLTSRQIGHSRPERNFPYRWHLMGFCNRHQRSL